MERIENMEYKKAVEAAVRQSPPMVKIMAAAKRLGTVGKSRRAERGIGIFVFGTTDRAILRCYWAYWGSARNTKDSGELLKRMLSECMEEVLFSQYERGVALFCLIVEGLPGGWQPAAGIKKRIREKVRPLIAEPEKNSGMDNSGKEWK